MSKKSVIAHKRISAKRVRQRKPKIETGYGWKFLNPYGATNHRGHETLYPLPRPNEKWGPWFKHPSPITDGNDCGPGRWHVMVKLDARYAPNDWYPWFVQWRGLAGKSAEKIGVHELRLRRVPEKVFWKWIRLGRCAGANLSRATLSDADLSRANLSRAYLSGADLSGADLSGANLSRAYLSGADLSGADLQSALNVDPKYLKGNQE